MRDITKSFRDLLTDPAGGTRDVLTAFMATRAMLAMHNSCKSIYSIHPSEGTEFAGLGGLGAAKLMRACWDGAADRYGLIHTRNTWPH